MSVFAVEINEDEVKNDILKEIVRYLIPKFQAAARTSKPKAQEILHSEIINSVEYQHLSSHGRFYNELGIPDIKERLDKVIETVLENIEVQVSNPRIIGDNIDAHYSLKILKRDFSDVLALSEAQYEYVSKKYPAGHVLNWLNWLLLSGTSTIVMDYHFAPIDSTDSRTGFGLMLKGGTWNVAPFIGGTANDNFLMRATNRVAYVIIKAVEQEFIILDT